MLFHGQCWDAQTCQCCEALAGGGCHGHRRLRRLGKQSDVSGSVELLARLRSLTKTQPSDHCGPDACDTHQEDSRRPRTRTPAGLGDYSRAPSTPEREAPNLSSLQPPAITSSLRPVPGKDSLACHPRHTELSLVRACHQAFREGTARLSCSLLSSGAF